MNKSIPTSLLTKAIVISYHIMAYKDLVYQVKYIVFHINILYSSCNHATVFFVNSAWWDCGQYGRCGSWPDCPRDKAKP